MILDDHPIVRFGIQSALMQLPGYEIIGQAETVQEALDMAERGQPDLITLDLLLNGRMEISLIPRLKAICPHVRILAFTMSAEEIFAQGVLHAGAAGYLMKSDGLEELQRAVQRISAGKIYISERLNSWLLASAAKGRSEGALARLSHREMEIFQRLGEGMTTREIAQEMNLSVKTVATHRDNLKIKLNAATSAELVQKAVSCALGSIV